MSQMFRTDIYSAPLFITQMVEKSPCRIEREQAEGKKPASCRVSGNTRKKNVLKGKNSKRSTVLKLISADSSLEVVPFGKKETGMNAIIDYTNLFIRQQTNL